MCNYVSYVLYVVKKKNHELTAACSFFQVLSMMKVPKGIIDARKALVNQPKLFLYSSRTRKASIIYATYKAPCKPPMMVTARGIPAKYFIGMATSKRTRKEMPS